MFVVKNKKTKEYIGGMTGLRVRRQVSNINEAHVFKNKAGAVMAVTSGLGRKNSNARFLDRNVLIEVELVERGTVEW